MDHMALAPMDTGFGGSGHSSSQLKNNRTVQCSLGPSR